MEPGATSKLGISGSKQDALAAIREALPDDAIVRHQDDGVGRFAGNRVVMLIGSDGDRLMLSQGNWRLMKTLEESPQLEITFEVREGGCTVRMKAADPPKATLVSHLWGTLGNAATIAILIVAYHMFQDMQVDKARVAAISVGGGILWSALTHFWPNKRDEGLDKTVRAALRPMLVPKKKKKKKKKNGTSKADADEAKPDEADEAP